MPEWQMYGQALLDAKYGKMDEIAANRIRDLHKFAVTKTAHTENQRFSELYSMWREVYRDLAKIDLTPQLDNPHAINEFLAKFPTECQISYINYKGWAKNKDKPLGVLVNEWLKVEWSKQLALQDLQGDAKGELKDTGKRKCANCGLQNHKTKDC